MGKLPLSCVYPDALQEFSDRSPPIIYRTAHIKGVTRIPLPISKCLTTYQHDFCYIESTKPPTKISPKVVIDAVPHRKTKKVQEIETHSANCKGFGSQRMSEFSNLGGTNKDIYVKQNMRILDLRSRDLPRI